ncbi:MAG: hypothetical protein V2I43_04920 [Parvularcula sp.]|jgi:hypothetical protein|nr:hypothetical protein [Parvularcula sp.]
MLLIFYYLAVAAILVVWFLALRAWRRRIARDVSEGSAVEWQRLSRQDPELLRGLTEEEFGAIYARVETPRQPFYTFGATASFLLAAPLVLALTTLVIGIMERTGIIPQPAEQAQRLRFSAEGIQLIGGADLTTLQYILEGWGGFFAFFSLLALWVVVFTVAMRRYHGKPKGSLRDEVLRAR